MREKNNILRSRCTQYLLCILCCYPLQIMEKYLNQVEELIQIAVNEASSETRVIGRECYLQFAELFPTNAKLLIKSLSAAAQKALGEGIPRRSVGSEMISIRKEFIIPKIKKPYASPKTSPFSNENFSKASYIAKPQLRASNPVVTHKEFASDKPDIQLHFLKVKEPNQNIETKDVSFEEYSGQEVSSSEDCKGETELDSESCQEALEISKNRVKRMIKCCQSDVTIKCFITGPRN